MASNLLTVGLSIFAVLSIILAIFAPFFLQVINIGQGFSPDQISLMANLMRLIILSQLLFIIGTFFTALLQSYNHFFIPGFAAALYNLGIIIGLVLFHSVIGIYSAAVGSILGALIFIVFQIPVIRKVGFSFTFNFSFRNAGVRAVSKLMWPRTISIAIFQLGSLISLALVSFVPSSGRSYVILDYAQTLAFAPVALFGNTIAQAALPVLSREKDRKDNFKSIFMASFNQMLYLVLPVSVLILVLSIPIVRLIYGAHEFDWQATVLTGRTLAFFAISIFAQALITLAYMAFYALHDTKIPLIVGGISTLFMISISYVLIIVYHFGVESLAVAYSIGSISQLAILMFFLNKRLGGFDFSEITITLTKFSFATVCMAFALYIPLKLLDQLIFDTTRTVNLILLTGISSFIGISIYLFLTWILNVKEAMTFVLLVKRVGNWRDILGKS